MVRSLLPHTPYSLPNPALTWDTWDDEHRVAIALGYTHVPKYLNLLVNPILDAFNDKENSVRYFASESMYNCSKVARGEILIYFNEIFDTLSKVRQRYAFPNWP